MLKSTTVLSGGEIVLHSGANTTRLTLSSGAIEIILSSGGVFPAAARPRGVSTNIQTPVHDKTASEVHLSVQHLIHTMESFDAGSSSQGALFESVSGGDFHEETGVIVHNNKPALHH